MDVNILPMDCFVLEEKVNMTVLFKLKVYLKELYDSNLLGRFVDKRDGYKEISDFATIKTIIDGLYKNKKKSNEVHYSFSRKLKWGRMFSKETSLQGISRVIRHTIAKDIYDDVDIVNCHPVILQHYCETKEIPCSNLKKYNNNRAEYLSKVMEDMKIDKEDSKKLVLKIINGGNIDEKSPEYIKDFYLECKEIRNKFWKNKDNEKFKKRAENIKEYNKEGSALNYFLCEQENIILSHLTVKLMSEGLQVGTYCFDGCLVYKSPLMNPALLERLQNYILEKTGYKIILKIKEMDEYIKTLDEFEDVKDDEELKEQDEKAREMEEMKILDHSYQAKYFLDKMSGNMKYHKDNDKLYVYSDYIVDIVDEKEEKETQGVRNTLWRLLDFSNLSSLVYNVNKFQLKNDELLQKTLYMLDRKLGNNSYCEAVSKFISKVIKSNWDDSKFIDENFNNKKGYYPINGNYVINLKTLSVEQRTKNHYFTDGCDIKYNPNFDRDYCINYVKEILKTNDMSYVKCFKQTIGYILTGENNLKSFFIFEGEGNNGKSIFLDLLKIMFGRYACIANARIFKASKNQSCHDSETFSLMGKRCSFLSESNKDDIFNIDLIKKISGGDLISIRGCGRNELVETLLNTVLILACNNIPSFNVDDEAFIRRMKVFNFKNKFEVNVSKAEEILSKASDFFSYFCEGAYEYYNNNRSIYTLVMNEETKCEEKINFHPEVNNYTNMIVKKKDSFHGWLFENENTFFKITKVDSDKMNKNSLYHSYKEFCDDSKDSYKQDDILGRTNFYRKFEEYYKSITKTELRVASNKTSYMGIKYMEQSL